MSVKFGVKYRDLINHSIAPAFDFVYELLGALLVVEGEKCLLNVDMRYPHKFKLINGNIIDSKSIIIIFWGSAHF